MVCGLIISLVLIIMLVRTLQRNMVPVSTCCQHVGARERPFCVDMVPLDWRGLCTPLGVVVLVAGVSGSP